MNFIYDDSIKRFLTGGSPLTPNTHGHLETIAQDGIEDPTYIGFTLKFDFHSAAMKQNYNRLVPGLLLPSSDLESAQGYLRRNNQMERADYLEEFRTRLKAYSEHSPWLFQQVSGLSDVLKRPEAGKAPRGYEKWLVVDCLETMDMRMSFLGDLYRKAVYDFKHDREIVPDPQVKFNLMIIVSEIRNIKFVHDAITEALEDVNWGIGQNSSTTNTPNAPETGGLLNSLNPGVEIPQSDWMDQGIGIVGGGEQFFKEGTDWLGSNADEATRGIGDMGKKYGGDASEALGLNNSQFLKDAGGLAGSVGDRGGALAESAKQSLGFLAGSSTPPPPQTPSSASGTERAGDTSNVFSDAYNEDVASRFFAGNKGQYAAKVLSTFATHRVIFLDHCEFEFETFPYLETMSMGKFPEQATFQFRIKVGTVTEVNQYGFFEWILNDYYMDSAGPQPGTPGTDGRNFTGTLREFEMKKSPYSAWTNPEQRGVDPKLQIARKESQLAQGPLGQGTTVGIGDTLDIKGKALGFIQDNLGLGQKSKEILDAISNGEDNLNRLKMQGGDALGSLSALDFTSAGALYSGIMKTKEEIEKTLKQAGEVTNAGGLFRKNDSGSGANSPMGNAYALDGFKGGRDSSQSEREGFDDFNVTAGYKNSIKDKNVSLTSENATTNELNRSQNAYSNAGGGIVNPNSRQNVRNNIFGDNNGIDNKIFPSEFKKDENDMAFRSLRDDLDFQGLPHKFKNIGLDGAPPKKDIGGMTLDGPTPQSAEPTNVGLEGAKAKTDLGPVELTGAEAKTDIGKISLEGAKAQTNIGTISLEGPPAQTNIGKISLEGPPAQTNIGQISLEGAGKLESPSPTSLEGIGAQQAQGSNVGLQGPAPQEPSKANVGLDGAGKQSATPGNIGLQGAPSESLGNSNIGQDGPPKEKLSAGNIGLEGAPGSTSMTNNVGLEGAPASGTPSGNIGLEGAEGGKLESTNVGLEGQGATGGSAVNVGLEGAAAQDMAESNVGLEGNESTSRINPLNIGHKMDLQRSTINPRNMTFSVGQPGKISPKNIGLASSLLRGKISPKNAYTNR